MPEVLDVVGDDDGAYRPGVSSDHQVGRDKPAIQTHVIHSAHLAGTNLAAMPSKLYGPGDNDHPTNSHVIPALLRKFHEGRQRGDASVTVWGSGTPRVPVQRRHGRRLRLPDEAARCEFGALLGSDESVSGRFEPPLVNVSVGQDITIADLAASVARVVGYTGGIAYDSSKPDGTPRKVRDVGLLAAAGWTAKTALEDGLACAYAEFKALEL